jgi:hypothetical protein
MMLTAALLLSTIAAPAPVGGDTACQKLIAPIGDTLPDQYRQMSPLDSVSFKVGGKSVKICYGRPSLRGREMVVGEQNPYGEVWRTGANEPTIIYTSAPITIAGVKVPAGVHSLYTIPNEQEWDIIINKGTTQWGLDYDQSQDVGRGKAKSEAVQQPIEQFTIRPDAAASAKELLLEWQKFRVHVPLAAD